MLILELEGSSYKSETPQEELGRDKSMMSRAARASGCLEGKTQHEALRLGQV